MVEERESELSELKELYKAKRANYQKMCTCVSIVNGMNICQNALTGKSVQHCKQKTVKMSLFTIRPLMPPLSFLWKKCWPVLLLRIS